ncbi:MAG: hypothetical protein AAF985_17790, partial [Bacteroidota bacterium]
FKSMKSIIEAIRQQNEASGEIDLEVKSFICVDWNVDYNLHNPENFEDPEHPPVWYDPEMVYEYYEKPYLANSKINIYASRKINNFDTLIALIEEAKKIEHNLLKAIVHYTFGDGGAYAASKYYRYAKRTMEILHDRTFEEEAFLMRNLRLSSISFGDKDRELRLHFDCSWDEEHGLTIKLEDNERISFE